MDSGPKSHWRRDHRFLARAGVLVILVLIVFILFGLRTTVRSKFEYYVVDPMPASVRNIQIEGDEFRISPEPVCFVRFNASPADIDLILRSKGFKEVENSFDPPGPPWWDVSTRTGVRVFLRQHRPKRETMFFFGKNRRWTEILRIDDTGTNAYFLVWGI